MVTLRRALIALALALGMIGTVNAQGDSPATPTVALKGYDIVSYFKQGRAAHGLAEFRREWDGASYLFANAQYRAAFASEPERYLPQFSSYCAMGVSIGKKVEADPTLWKIVDGRLYVFSSAKALDLVDKDPSILSRSHQNWSGLK